MTDEPFDVEALRADLLDRKGQVPGFPDWQKGFDACCEWVLSLLPDPPPKYEVVSARLRSEYIVRLLANINHVAAAFNCGDYPDAEQRAREECARLNAKEQQT